MMCSRNITAVMSEKNNNNNDKKNKLMEMCTVKKQPPCICCTHGVHVCVHTVNMSEQYTQNIYFKIFWNIRARVQSCINFTMCKQYISRSIFACVCVPNGIKHKKHTFSTTIINFDSFK